MKIFINSVLFILVLFYSGISSAIPVAPVSGSVSYAILACRFAGTTLEPATISQLNDILGVSSSGPSPRGTVDNYWREVSYNSINLAGSAVFGWSDLPKTWAMYRAETNWQDNLLTDCIAATRASNPSFNPHNYDGIGILINDYFPAAAAQPSFAEVGPYRLTLNDGTTRLWRVFEVSKPDALKRSAYAHEIGHTLGLVHSHAPNGEEYGSPWDIMSSGSCTPGDDACMDVHTIAYDKSSLGWLPASRKLTISGYSSTTTDLLVSTHLPAASVTSPIYIEVPTGDTNTIMTLESRIAAPGSYDSILPASGVIIHRVQDAYSINPTITLQGAMLPPPNEYRVDLPTTVLTPGESYSANIGPVGTLGVHVNREIGGSTPNGYNITVTLSPPPPFSGCAPGQQDQISETECNALVSLARTAASAPTDWMSTALPCSWSGVSCRDTNGDGQLEVTGLVMQNPAWHITFTSANTIFSGLANLRTLDMRNYNVNGDMPDSVYGLTHLTELDASGFTGRISPLIGHLNNLVWLGFFQARFSGTLPAEIGNLSHLKHIYINNMPNITGIMPPQWVHMGSPSFLAFGNSDICIPDDPTLQNWLLHDIGIVYPLDHSEWQSCSGTDISLVLDDTASMQQPTGDGTGNTKIQSLRNAISMFTGMLSYFRAGMGDKAGAISFKVPVGESATGDCRSDWTQNLVSLGDSTSTLPSINSAAAALPADGVATPIRAGIVSGSSMLSSTTDTNRRLMVLLTDGKQNTSGCYIGAPFSAETVDSFRNNYITSQNIKLMAVGFGSGGEVDSGLLNQLATDGYYDSASSSLDLNEWFAQTLSVALGQTIVLDPQGSIRPGQRQTHSVPLTGLNKSVTFLLSWARRDSTLGLSIEMPDGTVISDTDPHISSKVKILSGASYKAIVLKFPLSGALKGKRISGTWKIHVRQAKNGKHIEPYQYMVMADSPIKMTPIFPKKPIYTTGRLPLRVRLPAKFRADKLVANIAIPTQGTGTILARLNKGNSEVLKLTKGMPSNLDVQSLRIDLIKKAKIGWPIKRHIKTIQLYDDGQHNDGKRNDGIYGTNLGPLVTDGDYSVLFHAEGTLRGGQKFVREFKSGIHVGVDVDPQATDVVMTQPNPKKLVFDISITPKDANGLLQGPGYASRIGISIPNATVGKVNDLGNGTYTTQIALKNGTEGELLNINWKGSPLASMILRTLPPKSVLPWYLFGLAILLLMISLYFAYKMYLRNKLRT